MHAESNYCLLLYYRHPTVKTLDLKARNTLRKVPVKVERIPVAHIKRFEENVTHMQALIDAKESLAAFNKITK